MFLLSQKASIDSFPFASVTIITEPFNIKLFQTCRGNFAQRFYITIIQCWDHHYRNKLRRNFQTLFLSFKFCNARPFYRYVKGGGAMGPIHRGCISFIKWNFSMGFRQILRLRIFNRVYRREPLAREPFVTVTIWRSIFHHDDRFAAKKNVPSIFPDNRIDWTNEERSVTKVRLRRENAWLTIVSKFRNADHPSVRKFVQALKGVQKGRDIYFDRASDDEEPVARKSKYVVVD